MSDSSTLFFAVKFPSSQFSAKLRTAQKPDFVHVLGNQSCLNVFQEYSRFHSVWAGEEYRSIMSVPETTCKRIFWVSYARPLRNYETCFFELVVPAPFEVIPVSPSVCLQLL